MIDELELAEAVAEGAEFMDAIDANVTDDERWFWVVDPDTLDMSMSTAGHLRRCGCILGQHSPSGYFDPEEYALGYYDVCRFGLEASRPGWTSREAEYAALTALWREEIIDRRAAWFDAHPEAVIA